MARSHDQREECHECTSDDPSTRLQQPCCYQSCCTSGNLSGPRHLDPSKRHSFPDSLIVDKCLESCQLKQPTMKTQQGLCDSYISSGKDSVSGRFPVGLREKRCMHEAQLANENANFSLESLAACSCNSKCRTCMDDLSLYVNSSSTKIDGCLLCCDCRNNLESTEPYDIPHMLCSQSSVLQSTCCVLCNSVYEACQIPNCQDCEVADLEREDTTALVGNCRAGAGRQINGRFTSGEIRRLRHKFKKTHTKDRRHQWISTKRFVT